MDAKQKEEIAHLRMQGMTYEQVAKQLQLSVNTVKSYCQRNQLGGRKSTDSNKHFCRQCGVEVKQTPHRKLKKFCSDKCRMKWWNGHPEKLHRKSGQSIVCLICENVFFAYVSANRKYCSRECYGKSKSEVLLCRKKNIAVL